jgi:hypothetical protein
MGRTLTRAQLLRATPVGVAALGGAVVAGLRSGAEDLAAAPSAEQDVRVLNLFLALEQVQQELYRRAVASGKLSGALRQFATTVEAQETQHVAFLRGHLGSRARNAAVGDLAGKVGSAEGFRAAAVELEEAAIAAYIGQAPQLTRKLMPRIATLVSVEARQVAWLRDLAGSSPAPRAADPAKPPGAVLAQLRSKGYLR